MKFTHLSTVSALALVLALGAPATAQQTTDQPADEPAATTQADDTTVGETAGTDEAPGVTNIGLSVAELQQLINEMGVEDINVFGGDAAVARTQQGHRAIVLVGPQDFDADAVATLGVEAFRDLRQQMTDAGFQDVTEARGWQPVQGSLDGHLVIAADPVWEAETDELLAGADAAQTGEDVAERDTAEPRDGTAERAIGEPAGAFDRDRFGEAITEAGIEDGSAVQGKLVRARTGDGQSFNMLIGPQGFAADQEVGLGEDELRGTLEGAGLSEVQFVEEGIAMYRGSYEDMAVLVVAGPALADQTGQQSGTADTGTGQED